LHHLKAINRGMMNKILSRAINVEQKTARINDPPTPMKIDFTAAMVIFIFFPL